MKVAILAEEFPSPSETFVSRHVTSLIEAGVDVTVIAASPGSSWANIPEALRDEVRARTRLIDADLRQGWRQAIRALPDIRLFARKLRRKLAQFMPGSEPLLGRYDVILAHFGPGGVSALHYRDKGFIAGRIATVFHGYDMSVEATIRAHMVSYRRLFAETEALLPISHFWAERLRGWGAPAEKIRVLRMGADMPETAIDWDRPLHQPLRVLQVGRLVEKKAALHSIEAVQLCRAPVTLDLIGSGPMEAEVRARVASAQGPNRINMRGSIPHPDVLRALDETDVFLLPSVTAADGDMEGIPVALMEAMLHGCIVVSTKHSGIPELVQDGFSGLLVPERSAQAIADALASLAEGKQDVAAIRRNAVDFVSREFDNAKLSADLVDILERVTDGCPLSG